MRFVYANINLSGIGDRIVDLILLYTFARLKGYERFYVEWKLNKNDNDIYSVVRKEKTPFRSFDILPDNLLNYIVFPEFLHIVSNEQINQLLNEGAYNFQDYLGVRYSVNNFLNIFYPNVDEISRKNFNDEYFRNFQRIRFQNIPQNIVDSFQNKNVVTVHLRRSDKVINDGKTSNNIGFDELEDLNNKTQQFVDKCISKGYNNICFISDEKNVRNQFIENNKSKCNIISFDGDNVSQTYYDLYSLANSKIILVSQQFSAFSLLGHLIGDNMLYYIYHGKFNDFSYKNMKHFTEF